MDHDQSGVGARPERQDRIDRSRKECRRRALVRFSVQRVLARREGLDRRCVDVRPGGLRPAVAHRLRVGLRSANPSARRLPLMRASLIALIALSGTLSAQTVAITGGRVYTVSGATIENGTVLIRDGKIAQVGANITVPADARRIDAAGKWVTPGLINAATNLGLVEVAQEQGTRDASARGKDAIAAAFTVIDGFNAASVLLAPAREEG